MSETSLLPSTTTYMVAAAVGGTTMSLISAIGNYALDKDTPTPKTVARDFILGAVLLLLIMQLLPESTTRLVSYIMAMTAITTTAVATPMTSAITEAVTSVTETIVPAAVTDAALSDLEVKVGVPRF
jgi:hypothetical protein